MTNEELAAAIEKLQYQISVIADTIDYDTNPVELLILSMNWDRKELNKAHDIFEKWDKILNEGGAVNQHQFESDFDRELGVSYQGVKSVVRAFYRNDQWTDVIEAFVDGMGPHPSVEYLSIKRREK